MARCSAQPLTAQCIYATACITAFRTVYSTVQHKVYHPCVPSCPKPAVAIAIHIYILAQAAVAPLRPMLARAYAMLGARAYVHQYGSHGLGVADLEACLATVEDTLASYDSLSL
jgi:hypothetical protein